MELQTKLGKIRGRLWNVSEEIKSKGDENDRFLLKKLSQCLKAN
jgi:hypothetical protein